MTGELDSVALHRSPRRTVVLVVTSLVALVLVVLALDRLLDWQHAFEAARTASAPMLGGAAVLNLGAVWLRGVAWRLLLPGAAPHATRETQRATWVGTAVNSVAPANTGAIVRLAMLARSGSASWASAASSLVLQRALEGLAAVLLFAALAPLLPAAIAWRVPRGDPRTALIALLVVVVVATAWTIVRRRHGAERIRGWLREIVGAARQSATPTRLAGAFAASIATWMLQFGTFFLCLRAVGLEATAGATFLVLAVTNFTDLVRLTPGNLGVLQLAFVAGAALGGLPRDHAGAGAVLLQLFQTVPVWIVAVGMLLMPRGRGDAR